MSGREVGLWISFPSETPDRLDCYPHRSSSRLVRSKLANRDALALHVKYYGMRIAHATPPKGNHR